MLVCPMLTPIRYARRVVRITALAILGSATRTSLTSCGRSTTTDLPTPRGTKFDPNSEATTFTPAAGASSGTRCAATANSLATATSNVGQANRAAVRQRVQFAIADVPLLVFISE